jgi:predicted nucleic acid-binding protein
MRTVFADACYWIALANPRDDLHQKAIQVSAALGPARLVTSEMVLNECLNHLAGKGAHLRRAVVEIVNRVRRDPNTTVFPQTSILFHDALALYSERPDKTWSHTDCSSFVLMRNNGLTEALTYDVDFEQAGYNALLREEG